MQHGLFLIHTPTRSRSWMLSTKFRILKFSRALPKGILTLQTRIHEELGPSIHKHLLLMHYLPYVNFPCLNKRISCRSYDSCLVLYKLYMIFTSPSRYLATALCSRDACITFAAKSTASLLSSTASRSCNRVTRVNILPVSPCDRRDCCNLIHTAQKRPSKVSCLNRQCRFKYVCVFQAPIRPWTNLKC